MEAKLEFMTTNHVLVIYSNVMWVEWYMYVFAAGSSPDVGVPDMTVISDIDEKGINKNLKVRYDRNQIYVSFSIVTHSLNCLR